MARIALGVSHGRFRESPVLRRVRHPGRLAQLDRARGRGDAETLRFYARLAGLRRRLARRISGRHGRGTLRPHTVLQARHTAPAQSRADPAALSCRHAQRGAAPRPQSGVAPARRLARRAARDGAAQTQIHAGAGIERQHLADGRSGAAQQSAVGRHPRFGDRRRLQAKTARLSRRRASARSAAARMHDGRRPHQGSHGGSGARATHRPHRAPQRTRPRPRRDRAQREGRFRREEVLEDLAGQLGT